jgi:CDP-diacylglycerol--glycerol-3-phosphate 3-phosphatidyltransferase
MMDGIKRKIPNLLTILRLILIIPLVLFFKCSNWLALTIIASIIILSDYLDGRLARAWNAVSSSGKILDPLVDKICTAVAAVMMVLDRGFPIWLLLLLVVRDLIILAAGLFLIKGRQFIPVSNFIGRITMGMITACLLIYLFRIEPLKIPAVNLTVFVLLVSIGSYGRNFFQILKKGAN